MGSNENTMHVDDVHRKPQKAWEEFVVLWRVGRISQKLNKDVVQRFRPIPIIPIEKPTLLDRNGRKDIV